MNLQNDNRNETAARPYFTADHDEEVIKTDGDAGFHIPLRFTKSGRKRAVPFPLKVSHLSSINYSPFKVKKKNSTHQSLCYLFFFLDIS